MSTEPLDLESARASINRSISARWPTADAAGIRDSARAVLAEVDRLAAENAALRAAQQRAIGFAQQRATTARAVGRPDRERQWLDLIILLEQVAALDGAES